MQRGAAVSGVYSQRVVELLKRVAAGHPDVAKQPWPQLYMFEFTVGAVSDQDCTKVQ